MTQTYHTYQEINSQTQAWQDAWETVSFHEKEILALSEEGFEQAIFVGCGSTYYLSIAGAALFQRLCGIPAYALPAGELLLMQAPTWKPKTLLVAISRSGSTTETIHAVKTFRRQDSGKVLAITNYPDQPLAALGDLSLIIKKGQERSIAQTRSFTSMYLAATTFIAIFAHLPELHEQIKKLPSIGERILATYDATALEFGACLEFERIYFLGSGLFYGLACEANLKMKEMTLTHSEAFHFLEFRHGPMSMVNEHTLLVGLLSEEGYAHQVKVLNEMSQLGASVLTVGESHTQVSFSSNLPEAVRGVLYLPVLQLMAYYRAVAKRLDPDHPKNLTSVVKIDLPNNVPQYSKSHSTQ